MGERWQTLHPKGLAKWPVAQVRGHRAIMDDQQKGSPWGLRPASCIWCSGAKSCPQSTDLSGRVEVWAPWGLGGGRRV